MKTIHLFLEDKEYEKLSEKKKKSGLSWHDFVLKLAKIENDILPSPKG